MAQQPRGAQGQVPATKDHPGLEGIEERAKRNEEASLATFARMSQSRPTPSQLETDLAKVGALDLDAPKADDGSGPELVHVRHLVPADQLEEGGYTTRAMSGSGQAQRPARPGQQPAQQPPQPPPPQPPKT